MSLASEETPPRCYLLLLLHTQNAPHEFFQSVAAEKFPGLTTNRLSAKVRDARCVPRKKKRKEKEEGCGEHESAARVMEILRDFCCLRPVEISAPVRLIFRANSRAEFHLGGRPSKRRRWGDSERR